MQNSPRWRLEAGMSLLKHATYEKVPIKASVTYKDLLHHRNISLPTDNMNRVRAILCCFPYYNTFYACSTAAAVVFPDLRVRREHRLGINEEKAVDNRIVCSV